MMNDYSAYLLPGIAFVLTTATGIWLSQLGKPLNGVLFTVHKLVAVAAVIAATIPLYTALRSASAPTLAIMLLIAGGISVVVLFATGALISLNHPAVALLQWAHRIAPVLALLTIGWAAYLIDRASF